MKLLFWIFGLIAVAGTTDSPAVGTLRIMVENVKESQGKILLAVYADDRSFLSEVTYRSVHHQVSQAGVVTVEVPDLPYGNYAISLYHDENNNGKIDTNFMKIPKEPYGFSNNVRGTFGPPKFRDARFAFVEAEQEIRIEIR